MFQKAIFTVGTLLFAGLAQAAPFLENDVVCRGQGRTILISEDLTQAVVKTGNQTTLHEVSYSHHTGGRGQILVLEIEGLDELHGSTVITDIFALGRTIVRGYRDQQVGFGVRILEELKCRYQK